MVVAISNNNLWFIIIKSIACSIVFFCLGYLPKDTMHFSSPALPCIEDFVQLILVHFYKIGFFFTISADSEKESFYDLYVLSPTLQMMLKLL